MWQVKAMCFSRRLRTILVQLQCWSGPWLTPWEPISCRHMLTYMEIQTYVYITPLKHFPVVGVALHTKCSVESEVVFACFSQHHIYISLSSPLFLTSPKDTSLSACHEQEHFSLWPCSGLCAPHWSSAVCSRFGSGSQPILLYFPCKGEEGNGV